MNKATKILTLPIVDIAKGAHHGCASNILLNRENNEVYLTLESNHPGELQLLPAKEIKGIGEDYLLIADQSVLVNLCDECMDILQKSYRLLGVPVVDATGTHLGEVADFLLDVKHQIAALLLQNGQEIKGEKMLSVCREMVFVTDTDELSVTKEQDVPVDKEELVQETAAAEAIQDTEKRELPLGLTLQEDITSEDGQFHLEKGSVITEAVLEEAQVHDALLLLAMYAE